MSFVDSQRADEVGLSDHLTVQHPDTGEWLTGKVVQLTLMADDFIRITLQTGSGYAFYIDRRPTDLIIYEIGGSPDA